MSHTILTKAKELSRKGKAQYCRPPCTNLFRSAAFDFANILDYLIKQVPIMRRSTVLSLPLQLVFLVEGIVTDIFLLYWFRLVFFVLSLTSFFWLSLMDHLHWQHLLAKPSVTATCDCNSLSRLGRRNTDRIISISLIWSTQVRKLILCRDIVVVIVINSANVNTAYLAGKAWAQTYKTLYGHNSQRS